jgi:hypothetical protein
VYLHTTSAGGHLRANIERDRRVCFEIDEQEGVFDYGRFECDSGLAYRSVCLFGRIRIVDDREVKQRFCEALMAKYGKPETKRPKGFFPRIDVITVYGRTSLEWAQRTESSNISGRRMLTDVITQQGGAPIKFGDETIGGVGLSGAPNGGQQEEACAKAGRAKVADQLKP